MPNKRFCILALAALNGVLLAGLIAMCGVLPQAQAQGRGGGAGKYATVTAEFTEGTDAVYILHAQQRRLTVLVPDQNQNGRLVVVSSRDLAADLGG